MKQGYTIKRSSRKTVALVVTKNAQLEVRAPLRTSKKEIERIVLEKAEWIEKTLARQRELLEQPSTVYVGGTLLLFGQAVQIVSGSVKKAQFDGEKVTVPVGTDSQTIKPLLKRLMHETAAGYIKPRVEKLAPLSGSVPSAVSITSAKTRWGSCSADRLSFSHLLVAADPQAIDYVIFHELSHIKHHNHSPQFWAEVARVCPEYAACRQRLKTLARQLDAENIE